MTERFSFELKATDGKATSYQLVKVKFTLHKKEFGSGFSASALDLETVEVLTPESNPDQVQLLATLFKEFTEHYLGRIREDMATEALTDEPAPEGDDIPF